MRPICLIIPPSPFLLDQRVFMSLGILRVAAVLEQAGYPVELVDLSGVTDFEAAVAEHAPHTEATVFGITATTPQMPAAVKISEAILAVKPISRRILGGPHITLVNAAVKREVREQIPQEQRRSSRAQDRLQQHFDILVAGDGEQAIFEALQPRCPTLIDADDPKGRLFLTNERLNELPFPARHLVDVGSYHYTIEGVPALSLIAQLGCPFNCGFCGGRESAMLRRVRMRTTENVIAEMEQMHREYGVRGFMLYDDELNVNKQMLELMRAIAALQDRLNVEFRLRGFIKAQLFTEAQAEAMYRAGFRWILVGFESGSPRILENINKKATREENTRCLEIARRHGLKVKALMSLGHPGENDETASETWDWLHENAPDDFDMTIITTYPGTPYYDQAVQTSKGVWTYTAKNGDRLHAYDVDFLIVSDFYKGGLDDYHSYVFTDHLSSEEMVIWRDYIERDIRKRFGIAFPQAAPGVAYEHSMGQHGLSAQLLRATAGEKELVCG